MTPSSNLSRRRWLVPQFSLRALFLLVNISAIGTAFWYRWPIVEEIDLYAQLSPTNKARTKPQNMRATREVNTYRRVWGGKRVRNGWSRQYDFQGRLVREEQWREGVRHGPSRHWFGGELCVEGNYLDGRKDGIWRYDLAGNPRELDRCPDVESWQNGAPHGIWKFRPTNLVPVQTMEFQDGMAVRVNGKPWLDPLMKKQRAAAIDDQRINQAVGLSTAIDFVQTPLKDVLVFLGEVHAIPLRLHAREVEEAAISVDTPINAHLTEVPLSVALVTVLQPLGLVADYRYGCVVVCPAAGAEDWRDSTGVSEIQPRPRSILAEAWERPVKIDFVECPFDQVIADLSQQTEVRFDIADVQEFLAQIRMNAPITMNSNTSLKNTLGILCNDLQFYVQLQGDDLVLRSHQPDPRPRIKKRVR